MKMCFKRKDGSTLVILVIAITVISMLGVSLLGVTMRNFKIKITNTEIKQSFYMSESGLNNAYADAYNLVIESFLDSAKKAEQYLEIYPLNKDEAINIFKDNYKTYIAGNIKYRINKDLNPMVKIKNEVSLCFIEDKLTVLIDSKYTSQNNIEKTTAVNLIIEVPVNDDMYGVVIGLKSLSDINFSILVSFENWQIII